MLGKGKFYHSRGSLNRVNLHFRGTSAEKEDMKRWKLATLLTGMALLMAVGGAQEAPVIEQSGYKDQKKSLTPWGELPAESSFLSFKEWKDESDMRDLYPDWQKILTERSLREKVGHVFQCEGICRIDRGASFFNASHRTVLYEGDEIQTIGDSYIWIFLLDGTMVRLAPHSSITLNELNVAAEKNFFNVRFNAGNILWLSRHESLFEEVDIRETDTLFFPLKTYEAMPVTEVKPYEEQDLIELIEDKNTRLNQYKALNRAVEKNNLMTRKKQTFAFLIMPNVTVMGNSPNIEAVVLIGGKTFFKSRSETALGLKESTENDLQIQLRGFDNKEVQKISDDTWMVVDEKGRSLNNENDTYWLSMGEFLTKRIPSIMLGREIFLQQYSAFLFDDKSTALTLARDYGVRLWTTAELDARSAFLQEYFRRVETSNLLTSSRFRQRLEDRGDSAGARGQIMEYGRHFFIRALNHYYSYEDDPVGKEYDPEKEQLNSTKKLLWKKMHGIR